MSVDHTTQDGHWTHMYIYPLSNSKQEYGRTQQARVFQQRDVPWCNPRVTKQTGQNVEMTAKRELLANHMLQHGLAPLLCAVGAYAYGKRSCCLNSVSIVACYTADMTSFVTHLRTVPADTCGLAHPHGSADPQSCSSSSSSSSSSRGGGSSKGSTFVPLAGSADWDTAAAWTLREEQQQQQQQQQDTEHTKLVLVTSAAAQRFSGAEYCQLGCVAAVAAPIT
jgi:hypothetical protein